ncbi:hypothetical protein [Cupriavidus sp. TMH.W2]|uniref:hypothetical protein n=1 Tax=Cupriavidus sp. TMH.W2 TaxID=3434465 RepID=UPI003D781181
MHTPASLYEYAASAESTYRTLLSEFGPGTVHVGRNEARRQMEAARACAAWMEANGFSEIANVGPYMGTTISRGDKVYIRKGARIDGTGSTIPREGADLKRRQLVTVVSVDRGYLDFSEPSRNPKIVQGRVHWAGAGGYWRWTDINNVELASGSD